LGPAWVAAIVDSVGASYGAGTCGYWNNTVILITWDDWGGWYDHVVPPSTGYLFNKASASSGGQYVYGFRVPLLVVSGYSPKAGYVSGSASGNTVTACPNFRYCHDFGSILNFIEWVFGSANKPLPEIDSSGYHYADYYALDGPNNCGSACPYSLSDFFNFKLTQSNGFTYIKPPISSDGKTTYDANYFIKYNQQPQPPDED
jgi:hypothetical protein